MVLRRQLGDVEDQVRCGNSLFEFADDVNADHVRGQKVNRLAEHARLCFDTADSPAKDAEAVDHRCMRVRADESVRVVEAVVLLNNFGEIFKVHLVTDAYAGRDHVESAEALHAPFQESVPGVIALDFHVQVRCKDSGLPK